MTARLPFFLLLSYLFTGPLAAQGFSGGFKAGLNFADLSSDQLEMGRISLNSEEVRTFEDLNQLTGFHVGATFAYGFTDLVGIKADLMYTQRGASKNYEGPGYFYLYNSPDDLDGNRFFGNVRSELDIVNSYIDVPVMGYYRIGPVELEGGVSMGLLVNSRASGGATYTETVYGPNVEVTFNYDYNYSQDDPGPAGVVSVAEDPIPGTNFMPPSTFGAYYNDTDDGGAFSRLDFGLLGGINVFLNNGLYLGARYQYGLTDVTKEERDLAVYALPGQNDEREYRDDEDFNRVIQFSLGFRF